MIIYRLLLNSFALSSMLLFGVSLNSWAESETSKSIDLNQLQEMMKGIDLQKLSEQLNKNDLQGLQKQLEGVDLRKLEQALEELKKDQGQGSGQPIPSQESINQRLEELKIDPQKLKLDQIDLKQIESALKGVNFDAIKKKIDFDKIESSVLGALSKSSDSEWLSFVRRLQQPETRRLVTRLTDTNWKLFSMTQILFLMLLIVAHSSFEPAKGFFSRAGRLLVFVVFFLIGSYVVIPLSFFRGDYAQLVQLGQDLIVVTKNHLSAKNF